MNKTLDAHTSIAFRHCIAGGASRVALMSNDDRLKALSNEWLYSSGRHSYGYNFSFLGRPIVQLPQDMVALQEIIWDVRPDLIIETGIAYGGSLILSASMLALLDMTEAIEGGQTMNPAESRRKVLGVDIDIRAHNREAIEAHPLSSRIKMIQGSSIDPAVVEEVHAVAKGFERVLLCLDSMHTHDHVLAELKSYAPLVSPGSYCVVFDTVIEDMPASMFQDRPWGPGNSPWTAVHEFVSIHRNFEIDHHICQKLLISACFDGFLRRHA